MTDETFQGRTIWFLPLSNPTVVQHCSLRVAFHTGWMKWCFVTVGGFRQTLLWWSTWINSYRGPGESYKSVIYGGTYLLTYILLFYLKKDIQGRYHLPWRWKICLFCAHKFVLHMGWEYKQTKILPTHYSSLTCQPAFFPSPSLLPPELVNHSSAPHRIAFQKTFPSEVIFDPLPCFHPWNWLMLQTHPSPLEAGPMSHAMEPPHHIQDRDGNQTASLKKVPNVSRVLSDQSQPYSWEKHGSTTVCKGM